MLPKNLFLKYSFVLALAVGTSNLVVAQTSKRLELTPSDVHQDDIVMTWNKNTPESEMKDDCKALAEKGITIKYSEVKRNSNNEITAIKVSYADRKGNKGNLEYDNQKPIGTIQFYKNGEQIGFGNTASTPFGSADFLNGMGNVQDLVKQFQFNNGAGESQSFQFSFPNDEGGLGQLKSKTKIKIQRDDKKPLVIEDGKIIEGGDDYTPEELEKIQQENRVESFDFKQPEGSSKAFDFRNQDGLDQFKKQMEQMKSKMEQLAPTKSAEDEADFEKTKKEMIQAKEELMKAKQELEKAKQELQKPKAKVKTQKA